MYYTFATQSTTPQVYCIGMASGCMWPAKSIKWFAVSTVGLLQNQPIMQIIATEIPQAYRNSLLYIFTSPLHPLSWLERYLGSRLVLILSVWKFHASNALLGYSIPKPGKLDLIMCIFVKFVYLTHTLAVDPSLVKTEPHSSQHKTHKHKVRFCIYIMWTLKLHC